MLKVLTYDAEFERRAGERDFVVLVPFAPAQADTARSLVAAGAALSIKTMVGRTLRFEAVAAPEFEAQLVARDAGAVLVPSGTQAEQAKGWAAAATRHQRYTITLEEELVKVGILLGVALNGGKPQVILNATTARAIKAEFNSAVMRVARIQQ